MIVFSLTLFLFSSFTFFYKIRISKKPRTPRSTTWWVCLFKQCQCSCSRCIDILCWLGGCTRCPSRVSSPVSSKERTHAKHFTRVTALEGALICYLCPSDACFHEACRDFFLASSLPLCQMCFKLLSRWERCWADHASRPAGGMVIHGSSGNDTKAKLLCSAFSAMEHFIFSRGILCSSQNPKAIGNAEKWGWFHLFNITRLRTDLLESSLSLCCLGAAKPSPGAAGGRSAVPFQQALTSVQLAMDTFQ